MTAFYRNVAYTWTVLFMLLCFGGWILTLIQMHHLVKTGELLYLWVHLVLFPMVIYTMYNSLKYHKKRLVEEIDLQPHPLPPPLKFSGRKEE